MNLTPKQVAEILNVSSQTVNSMARRGDIPCAVNIGKGKIQKIWRFNDAEFYKWFSEVKIMPVKVKEKKEAEAPQGNLKLVLRKINSLETKLDFLIKEFTT